MNTASGPNHGDERRPRWSLRLLGGFELSAISVGERVTSLGKRERVLLAYLALSPNCRQPRRKLAALLWGDATDDTLLDNLRTCVWSVRRALHDTAHRLIASEGEDIVLDATGFDVDALRFRSLAARAERQDLEEAARLSSGALLDGLDIDSEDYESWRREEATRFRDQTIDVLTRLLAQLSDSGEIERTIQIGQRILTLEPLHEPAARRLMRLYADGGRRGPAIEVYRTLADRLRAELDAQPEPETRAVFAGIAHGSAEPADGSALDPAPVPASSRTEASARHAPSASLPLRAPLVRPIADPPRTSRLAWIVGGGAVVAAMAILLLLQLSPSNEPPVIPQQTGDAAAKDSVITVAVLPFANLSGDATQEFFSDGMTDEITTALAKVSGLRVVGRSSAFQFKGQNRDLRTIGQSLGTPYLIDGSVRMAGNRVRITAQLVRADSGIGLWTESYDRELTDVFGIQEDIATAIAGALSVPLGLAEGQRLVANREVGVGSYQQYLRAKALVRSRGGASLSDAVALLEQVVVRDPNYAPAWALLAQAHFFVPNFHPAFWSGIVEELRTLVDASLPRAEEAARRAIQLDPSHADGYVSLGHVEDYRGRLLQAHELYSKALSLDPTNSEALALYGNLLASVGYLKEALVPRQQLQELDPFVPIFNAGMATLLWENGQTDAAIEMFKKLPISLPDLARVYAAQGRFGEAAESLLAMTPGRFRPGLVEEAARLLRSAPQSAPSPQSLPRLGALSFVYLHIGASDRVLEFDEGNVDVGYSVTVFTAFLWHPSYAAVRKTDRFKAFARNAGMVDYWRERGWPEFCRPIGTDDFVCD
jgi:TolB-like protein/DNA-binding SARP family transcriptional activator